MRSYLESHLAAVGPTGHCELMKDLAEEYPIVIICELVGAPRADWPLFSRWADSIMKQFSFNLTEDLSEIETSLAEMDAYVAALVDFPKDSTVYLLAAAANRDPSVVSCPNSFDTTADRGSWTALTFGTGRHYCLGANLARAELQEAFGVLSERLRNLRLAGSPTMKPFMSIYGPERLPLAFEFVT